MSSQPIIITFNGQKQGTLPNTIIKIELKLPFLERDIIMQIECDRLDNEFKQFPNIFVVEHELMRLIKNIEKNLRKSWAFPYGWGYPLQSSFLFAPLWLSASLPNVIAA